MDEIRCKRCTAPKHSHHQDRPSNGDRTLSCHKIRSLAACELKYELAFQLHATGSDVNWMSMRLHERIAGCRSIASAWKRRARSASVREGTGPCLSLCDVGQVRWRQCAGGTVCSLSPARASALLIAITGAADNITRGGC